MRVLQGAGGRMLTHELALLRQHGDAMQSALSRLCEYLDGTEEQMPYEVSMARLEGHAAVDNWTDVRRESVAL